MGWTVWVYFPIRSGIFYYLQTAPEILAFSRSSEEFSQEAEKTEPYKERLNSSNT
jgi:hypothetical protein